METKYFEFDIVVIGGGTAGKWLRLKPNKKTRI